MSIEQERERHEYNQSKLSLKIANYQMIDDVDKRCNVCDSGQIVLFDGCRICKQHTAFVTCGATCDLQIRIKRE